MKTSRPNHPNGALHRAARAPARAWAVGAILAPLLGACELGLHEYQRAATDGCEPWQRDCPAVLDFTAAAPINPPRVDIDRTDIVAAAAAAPYRPCDTFTPLCQGRIIGDVLWDQYVMVLAGRPDAPATAASAPATTPTPAPVSEPVAPAPVVAPEAVEPNASGRIVRTQGSRAGEASPVRSAPSR